MSDLCFCGLGCVELLLPSDSFSRLCPPCRAALRRGGNFFPGVYVARTWRNPFGPGHVFLLDQVCVAFNIIGQRRRGDPALSGLGRSAALLPFVSGTI